MQSPIETCNIDFLLPSNHMINQSIVSAPLNDPFKGLFYYFNIYNYSRLHDLVRIEAAPRHTLWDEPENIIDFVKEHNEKASEFDGNYASNGFKDSFVKFSLPYHKIVPTHYSIRTRPIRSVDNTLQQWKLEGSKNGVDWKIIHSQPHTTYFQEVSNVNTFEVDQTEAFSSLKITQVGKNYNDSYILHLSRFEVFGLLIEKPIWMNEQKTCSTHFRLTKFFIHYQIILSLMS